jgi:hypothetical protein
VLKLPIGGDLALEFVEVFGALIDSAEHPKPRRTDDNQQRYHS